MNVNNEIKTFSRFLNDSFRHITDASKRVELEQKNIILADNIENGFLQFVWEMMVEAILCTAPNSLEPYGDGADFHARSSRVTFADKPATHCIKVYPGNAKDLLSDTIQPEDNFDFVKLISYNGAGYSQKPPFNFVLCDDTNGNKMAYSLDDIDFMLQEIVED